MHLKGVWFSSIQITIDFLNFNFIISNLTEIQIRLASWEVLKGIYYPFFSLLFPSLE